MQTSTRFCGSGSRQTPLQRPGFPAVRRLGWSITAHERQKRRLHFDSGSFGPSRSIAPVAARAASNAPSNENNTPRNGERLTLTPIRGVMNAILGIRRALFLTARNFAEKATANVQAQDPEVVNAQIKEMVKNMRTFAVVLPLASVSGTNAFLLITKAVSSFIKLYLLLLFLRVLLSWFPTFKWDRNPWIILRQVTDPYLNLFRGLVPPLLGTIDFTPLLGFIILQWLVGALDIGEEDRYW